MVCLVVWGFHVLVAGVGLVWLVVLGGFIGCFGFCLGFGVFWYCFGCVVGFLVGLALCELCAVFAVVDVCVWSC